MIQIKLVNTLTWEVIETLPLSNFEHNPSINEQSEFSPTIPLYALDFAKRSNYGSYFKTWARSILLEDTSKAWNDPGRILFCGPIVKRSFSGVAEQLDLTCYTIFELFKKYPAAAVWGKKTADETLTFSADSIAGLYAAIINSGLSTLGAPSNWNKLNNLVLPATSGSGYSYETKLSEQKSIAAIMEEIRDSQDLSNGNEFNFKPGYTSEAMTNVQFVLQVGTNEQPHLELNNTVAVPMLSKTSQGWEVTEYTVDEDATMLYNKIVINGSDSDDVHIDEIYDASQDPNQLGLVEVFTAGTYLDNTNMAAQLDARSKNTLITDKDITLTISGDDGFYWVKNLGKRIIVQPGEKTAGAGVEARAVSASYSGDSQETVTVDLMRIGARYPRLPKQRVKDAMDGNNYENPNFGTPNNPVYNGGDYYGGDTITPGGGGDTGGMIPGGVEPTIPDPTLPVEIGGGAIPFPALLDDTFIQEMAPNPDNCPHVYTVPTFFAIGTTIYSMTHGWKKYTDSVEEDVQKGSLTMEEGWFDSSAIVGFLNDQIAAMPQTEDGYMATNGPAEHITDIPMVRVAVYASQIFVINEKAYQQFVIQTSYGGSQPGTYNLTSLFVNYAYDPDSLEGVNFDTITLLPSPKVGDLSDIAVVSLFTPGRSAQFFKRGNKVTFLTTAIDWSYKYMRTNFGTGALDWDFLTENLTEDEYRGKTPLYVGDFSVTSPAWEASPLELPVEELDFRYTFNVLFRTQSGTGTTPINSIQNGYGIAGFQTAQFGRDDFLPITFYRLVFTQSNDYVSCDWSTQATGGIPAINSYFQDEETIEKYYSNWGRAWSLKTSTTDWTRYFLQDKILPEEPNFAYDALNVRVSPDGKLFNFALNSWGVNDTEYVTKKNWVQNPLISMNLSLGGLLFNKYSSIPNTGSNSWYFWGDSPFESKASYPVRDLGMIDTEGYFWTNSNNLNGSPHVFKIADKGLMKQNIKLKYASATTVTVIAIGDDETTLLGWGRSYGGVTGENDGTDTPNNSYVNREPATIHEGTDKFIKIRLGSGSQQGHGYAVDENQFLWVWGNIIEAIRSISGITETWSKSAIKTNIKVADFDVMPSGGMRAITVIDELRNVVYPSGSTSTSFDGSYNTSGLSSTRVFETDTTPYVLSGGNLYHISGSTPELIENNVTHVQNMGVFTTEDNVNLQGAALTTAGKVIALTDTAAELKVNERAGDDKITKLSVVGDTGMAITSNGTAIVAGGAQIGSSIMYIVFGSEVPEEGLPEGPGAGGQADDNPWVKPDRPVYPPGKGWGL